MKASNALVGLAVGVALVACNRAVEQPARSGRAAGHAVISDQVHNHGVPGFFWLPPLAPTTTYGEFKAGLSPVVSIGPLGGAPILTFTTVKTDDPSQYVVNWDTKTVPLDPSVPYRIHVTLQGFELGFADVDVVSSGNELRNVATSEYIPLLEGRTLPIKFRIEPDALRCVGVVCVAQDQCHDAGKCDPFTGVCSNPQKSDGVSCDDGNECTRMDTCQAGVCVGANPLICAASDQCHDPGDCDPATGQCSNPAKPDGVACDDGNACTRVDSCRSGLCAGTDPVTCTAIDTCHVAGTCDPAIGACSNPDSDCSDSDPCTLDGCDLKKGCIHVHQYASAYNSCPVQAPVPTVVFDPARIHIDETKLHANQHIRIQLVLQASADTDAYSLEFLLLPTATTPDGPAPQAISIGTWRTENILAGEFAYVADATLPPGLPPGQYEFFAHEYPDGAYPTTPLANVQIDSDPGLPVLDITAFRASQRLLFVDSGATVNPLTPATHLQTPFAAVARAVARDAPASQVSFRAYLEWSGASIPLKIWNWNAKQYGDSLAADLFGIDPDTNQQLANVPRSIALELALSEADAQQIRAVLTAGVATPATVTLKINEGGAVQEAPCPNPEQCRHAAQATTDLFLMKASETTTQQTPARLAVSAAPSASTAINTEALTFGNAYKWFAGDDTLGGGVAFLNGVTLSKDGYTGYFRAAVPVSLFNKSFDLLAVEASADPPTSAGIDRNAHISFTARMTRPELPLGNLVEVTIVDAPIPPADATQLSIMLSFQVDQTFANWSKTIIIYCVPVTVGLRAHGQFGITTPDSAPQPSHISVASASPLVPTAAFEMVAYPFGNVLLTPFAGLGIPGFEVGVKGDLSLAQFTLGSVATGTLTLTRDAAGRPASLAGSLHDEMIYTLNFLSGELYAFAEYPVAVVCKGPLGIKYPCWPFVRMAESDIGLASWPGFGLGPETFYFDDKPALDICIPAPLDCTGKCGVVSDGCNKTLDCSGQPGAKVCNPGEYCAPDHTTCVPSCTPIDCGSIPGNYCGKPNECTTCACSGSLTCLPYPNASAGSNCCDLSECAGRCSIVHLKSCEQDVDCSKYLDHGGLACGQGQRCDTTTTPNQCCTLPDCSGKCGIVKDSCGADYDCSTDPKGVTCGSGDVCTPQNACCTPRTADVCAARGFECGEIPDLCGGFINCGECGPIDVCICNKCQPEGTSCK